MSDYQSLLRKLPAVDRVLREPAVNELMERVPRRLVLQAIQDAISFCRGEISAHRDDLERLEKIDLSPEKIAREAVILAVKSAALRLKPVINATGVVIHTNLGRVPLAGAALDALAAVAGSYNNLEMSLETGNRGSRQEHIEALICELCNAEAAVVVNNNAAAVFLVLNTFAAGREVVVSRGQLVEIGGSFRIPEIMAASGARLVEVGTTNKTYLKDYEAVVNENTAAFLKVHTSNYKMLGFTAEVGVEELSSLARKQGLMVIEDLGSGVLLDLKKYGLPPEPRIQDSIASGADLVTFSGDKMLGGPQAGIIVGRKELIAHVRKNQLARTLRVDKFVVAALEATLRLYLDEDTAISKIPVWRMLTAKPEELKRRARILSERFAAISGPENIDIIEGISRVGGGALPMAELPTFLVSVSPAEANMTASELMEQLRHGDPPVIARLQHDSLLFDPRTISESEEDTLVEALSAAFKKRRQE